MSLHTAESEILARLKINTTSRYVSLKYLSILCKMMCYCKTVLVFLGNDFSLLYVFYTQRHSLIDY